jgi:hypothetical protein
MTSGGRGRRRTAVLSALGATVVVLGAATAWACVPFAGLRATPSAVEAGQAITLTGSNFRTQTPVVIRLDTLDGPELARFMVTSDKGPFFKETVVIPADVAPGHHILVATQETPAWAGPPWGIPARTVITVGGPSAPPPLPLPPPRTADLTQESVSATSFVLVAAGVAVVAVLGFGAAALLVSRRAEKPTLATVRS